MAEMLRNLCEKYKKTVSDNPDTVGQIESAFRLLSYVIAGRFHDSQVISELMFSASNLLVLLNDAILKGAAKFDQITPMSLERMMRFLTVIEYIEVFVEMAALRMAGATGRWIVITAIQIIKAVFRFVLLGRYNAGIQPTPPITPLNRDTVESESDPVDNEKDVGMTFTLMRSGRTIRKLASAPSSKLRDWKLPIENLHPKIKKKATMMKPSALNRHRVWAECFHIVKPLVHLASLYKSGTQSWKPWLLSCGLDISSLCLMGEPHDLNENEKGELRRRTFMLLFYLLRSPFYDRFAQAKIIFLLKIFADNIPGISLLIKPFLEYLPEWQKCYFYIWST
ncbi:hypothetical protein LOTGIDRAFT_208740 [Lottia gigantea]|uniref:Peroxisomal membrane protein PEX16 n=1 Tax=Lottia gigantea TaxID=225164 RepID=V4AKC8_LOTGI|nr:hypothetical protein LOTGIDRAFT_208740 [Lottia gigantea]ESO97557.1 hypothetical protein LOTGIDRAFT_208740 [Lottia gigantea]